MIIYIWILYIALFIIIDNIIMRNNNNGYQNWVIKAYYNLNFLKLMLGKYMNPEVDSAVTFLKLKLRTLSTGLRVS